MRTDRAVMALHAGALPFALAAALLWPRAGQAALLIPLGQSDLVAVFAWAEAEDAALLTVDPARSRVIARIPSNRSLLNAIRSGIVPIATRTAGCTSAREWRRSSWTN